MSSEPTVIYSAANTQQAHLLRGLLEQQGIAARVVNDAIQIAGGDLPIGWTAAAKVVVPEQDAVAARQLAEEFDRRTAHDLSDDDVAQTDELAPNTLALWSEWPLCPECSHQRSAQCPVCGTTGTSFPLADFQDSADGQRVLLMCAACDDHMLPKWYRHCPQCGHDFGDGIEPIESRFPTSALDPAVLWTVGLMFLGGVIFVAYFSWLFGWRTG
jgi:Putative prokaryotic signal transducing protein